MLPQRVFFGSWEVVKFTNSKGVKSDNIEGVIFHLDESGDVSWKVKDELKAVPLFNCETYELYSHKNEVSRIVLLRFGAYGGHVFEFRCDKPTLDLLFDDKQGEINNITLVYEGWCTIQCKRIIDDLVDKQAEFTFSLLPALEDGYFSNLEITASNNKKFKVHTSILQLLGCDIEWQSQPPPFTGLRENVLGTILHFHYTECLPNNMDENTAQEVIEVVSNYACLSKLKEMCQHYLQKISLKHEIVQLVSDMHLAIYRVIEHFDTKEASSDTSWSPAKLCYIIKQSVRDTSVAVAKLILLCDLFSKKKDELSKQERHEIILYAKSRLPELVSQMLRFLHVFKTAFSSMSSAQRVEVAIFLVPEIEIILDTITTLILEVEKGVLYIIHELTPKVNNTRPDRIEEGLKHLLRSKELSKLKRLQHFITISLQALVGKKENFNDMSGQQKIRTVCRNLEQIIEELPILEELTAAQDNKLEWKEFKFCFKVGTSKISGILDILVAHSEILQNILIQLCEIVQREAFTQALYKLKLLHPGSSSHPTSETDKQLNNTPKLFESYKLSLVESLCKPPSTLKSNLSKLSLQLFKTELGTDMEFEVVSNNSLSEQTIREHANDALTPVEDEHFIIRAHRVVVAARCDWFRRALLSGMKEAINRKIIIHDTNPYLFKIFLEYLYSGRLKQSLITTEQLAELVLISDRYEVDSLKQVCEYALESSIDDESVLYYLSMADQFNARILRNACLNYISQNDKLTESDLFNELPKALQAEISDHVWMQPNTHKSKKLQSLMATSSSSDTSLSDIPKTLSDIHLGQAHSNCSFMEELPNYDTARIEQCIFLLRDILGDEASEEKLVQAILAADYDLCRAIHYYYD